MLCMVYLTVCSFYSYFLPVREFGLQLLVLLIPGSRALDSTADRRRSVDDCCSSNKSLLRQESAHWSAGQGIRRHRHLLPANASGLSWELR